MSSCFLFLFSCVHFMRVVFCHPTSVGRSLVVFVRRFASHHALYAFIIGFVCGIAIVEYRFFLSPSSLSPSSSAFRCGARQQQVSQIESSITFVCHSAKRIPHVLFAFPIFIDIRSMTAPIVPHHLLQIIERIIGRSCGVWRARTPATIPYSIKVERRTEF